MYGRNSRLVRHSCAFYRSKFHADWNESAFISVLGRPFPPSFKPFATAGPILYASTIYHEAFPFQPQGLAMLTFDALLRAVAMITGREQRVLGGGKSRSRTGSQNWEVVTRTRTETDRCRLLFQSLAGANASLGKKSSDEKDEIIASAEVSQSTTSSVGTDFIVNVSANSHEDEGSEDGLDVIAATKSSKEHPKLVSTLRESLRPIVATLPRSHISLHRLRIPKDNFRSLLVLLLSLQLDSPGEYAQEFLAQLPELEAVANCVL